MRQGPTTEPREAVRRGPDRPAPHPRPTQPPSRRSGRWLKYAVDRVVAAVAIIVTAPLFVVIALTLLAHGVRAVLRVQSRIGDRGAFPLVSFAIPPQLEHRWIGRVLRGSGLVALPQVFGVLRGDLSLVGPRPRFAGEPATPARPGMLGPAQAAQARRRLDRDEVFALDAEYAERWSLGYDVRLIAAAVWHLFVPTRTK